MSQREILARLAPDLIVATDEGERALAGFLFREFVDAPKDSLTADALEFRRLILASGLERPETCDHKAAIPVFDEDAARGLDAREIRRRWPRREMCPSCGARGFFYASAAHYIAGDW